MVNGGVLCSEIFKPVEIIDDVTEFAINLTRADMDTLWQCHLNGLNLRREFYLDASCPPENVSLSEFRRPQLCHKQSGTSLPDEELERIAWRVSDTQNPKPFNPVARAHEWPRALCTTHSRLPLPNIGFDLLQFLGANTGDELRQSQLTNICSFVRAIPREPLTLENLNLKHIMTLLAWERDEIKTEDLFPQS